MLKVPAFEYFSDQRVTIYQDDSQFWKFYVIPDYVSIRRDINDNPVFLLIKYAFSDEDREENPDLPRGGGYMVFDTEMSVPEADESQIRSRLQQRVDQMWNAMNDLAEQAGEDVRGMRIFSSRPGSTVQLTVDDVRLGLPTDSPEAPPGDQPPRVQLAQPTWTEGNFLITAPQSEALVSNRVAEGPLSLVGNNVASVSMDLTSAGATFMQKTLLEPSGEGATDLTPIQIRYTLKHWARIPPVHLRITADSRSLYAALTEIDHEFESHSCDEDEMTHYETHLSMAIEANLIKVQFDTGTLSLEDDFLQEMRRNAMSLVQDLIKENFYDKEEDGDDEDEDDATSEFVNSEQDIYYLKTEVDFESVSIEYDEQMTSIVEWPVNPQGTLQTFLAGVSASEMRRYVREIDLADPFFSTLGLKVQAFADWKNEPIDFVEVQVRYRGRDENNDFVEKTENFTLTEDAGSGEWDPSLIGTKREYEYRWRVAFSGQGEADFTRWRRETTPQLNISVADPGKISVNVLAGAVNFKTVTQVQVEVSYRDPGSGVDEESTVLILGEGQTAQTYERYIFTEWDRPLRFRSTFILKDGQQIETDWEETLDRQLLINAPLYDTLDVNLIPAGDWDDVVQTAVSLRYVDEDNDYHVDEVYILKDEGEFKAWSVVLQNRDLRTFEYKVLATFKDGTFQESEDWIEADGDQALPVIVQRKPRLKVGLLPNLVDFEVTPIVECTLRYDDDGADIHEVETFTFTDTTIQDWNIVIDDEDENQYDFDLTYHRAEGGSVDEDRETTDVTKLIIPKLLVPEIVVTIFPNLVNFQETPVVEATIDYRDAANDVDFTDTLVFTDEKSQTVRFRIDEDSPTDYELSVTYFLADGQVVNRDPVTLSRKRLTLPRYVAEEEE
ncbi:MAG TPA: hypothetical protein VLV83_11445 [Acidobacteriota bacterium]|nr:hypothetical protein [Acidobacteriota bacterium]